MGLGLLCSPACHAPLPLTVTSVPLLRPALGASATGRGGAYRVKVGACLGLGRGLG